MTESGVIGITALALLQGALVALPRADALKPLVRLRSPVWAAILPASIVLGTFGVRALPAAATELVVLAGIATPLLSGITALGVMRGPRAATLTLTLTILVLAGAIGGATGQVSASVLTALGCSTIGMALVRLIPRRFIMIGVLCMCVTDVTLLVLGVGQPAAALMTHAEANVHSPVFDHATIGKISIDYPDLVLAAVLGGAVAGRRAQRRAALAVTMLAVVYGMFLPLTGILPATVPAALVFSVMGRLDGGRPGNLKARPAPG